MLAQLQRLSLFSLLLGMLLCAWAGWVHRTWWAWAGVALCISGMPILLAIEFIWMHSANRHEPVPRATIIQVVEAWAREVLTAWQVFFWRQPFQSHVVADQWSVHEADNTCPRGIILIHGFFCNRGLWNPWLQRLQTLGYPCAAINLEPVFGSLDDYADIIESAVMRMTISTGRPPLLVAHSMGGLAARAWLNRFNADQRMAHLITMGSPHHGTYLGPLGLSTNSRQMRRHSPWLRQLDALESPDRRRKMTCFYSHCDNIVFPACTASLAGAHNIHLVGVPHLDMAHDNRVFQEIEHRARA